MVFRPFCCHFKLLTVGKHDCLNDQCESFEWWPAWLFCIPGLDVCQICYHINKEDFSNLQLYHSCLTDPPFKPTNWYQVHSSLQAPRRCFSPRKRCSDHRFCLICLEFSSPGFPLLPYPAQLNTEPWLRWSPCLGRADIFLKDFTLQIHPKNRIMGLLALQWQQWI